MSNSTCDAKTRAGTPCELRAGWGTDHVGEGRCKLHGGASPRGADSPSFRHGGRSKYFDPSSIIGFDEWRASVGPTFGLEEDILALIYVCREKLLRDEPYTVMTKFGPEEIAPSADYISRSLQRIASAWSDVVKRHEGETIYVKLADRDVEELLRLVGEQIGLHVSDEAEVEAVLAGIKEAWGQRGCGGKS